MLKLHTFGLREKERGQFKFLRVWIAGYTEKKSGLTAWSDGNGGGGNDVQENEKTASSDGEK